METNDSTGLHINIGTFSKDEINNIDLLKFLLLVGENHVLRVFNRQNNNTSVSNIKQLIDFLRQEQDIPTNYEQLIKSINNIILEHAEKYSFANFSKLTKGLGYIEIRAPGGYNYEKI